MSAAEQPVSDKVASVLLLILGKCQSIESIVLSWPSRGRTFDLTRDRILHYLIPRSRQYAGELLDLHGLSFSPSPLNAYCRSRAQQCLQHILEVLDLFDLLQTRGTSLECDELDAYYAETFIINEEPSYNPREATNNHRVKLAMAHLMRVGDLGPQASQGNASVGLPGHVVPDLSEAMGQALSDLAKLVLEQSKPRYIHKYSGPLPYRWDNQTDPAGGSYGIIRKATSEFTGAVVAIKTISECFNDKDRLKIAHEIGTVEVCDHPNLIQLIDAYETPNGKIHLVHQPWAPFTLSMFLEQSESALARSCPWFVPGLQSSMDTVVGVLCGLADGLHYLHLKSIKHKDIKPENILLYHEAYEDVRPIITDFGTSKVYKSGRPTDYTGSTYAYLAPEQADYKDSSLKSDVWQLGCCFAKILTRACGGYTATLKLNDAYENTKDRRSCTIAKELVHFLPTLRKLCSSMPDVLDLTCGMLEEDPAKRWTIARVRNELARVMEGRRCQD